MNINGGEILDEIITRSRGEIRHTHSPKASSSTATPISGIRSANSLQGTVPSPRVAALRGENSLGSNGKELKSKQTP